jgi:hypothetical protein
LGGAVLWLQDQMDEVVAREAAAQQEVAALRAK